MDNRVSAISRWFYVLLASAFLAAAAWSVFLSWPQIQETFLSGQWGSRAYLYVILLFATLGLSAWCLKASGFELDQLLDGLALLGGAIASLVVVFSVVANPAALGLASFLVLVLVLIGARVAIDHLKQKMPAVTALAVIFPLVSFACLASLYLYTYQTQSQQALSWVPYPCSYQTEGQTPDPNIHWRIEKEQIKKGEEVLQYEFKLPCAKREQQSLDTWRVLGYLLLSLLAFYLLASSKSFALNRQNNREETP